MRLLGDWNDNLLDFSATSFVGKLSIDGGGGRDTIIGTAADDVIVGGHGADRLDGRGGNDRITGGSGADTFVFGKAWGRDVVRDVVTDFQDGVDHLDFHATGLADFKSLKIVGTGNDALISWNGNEVLLVGVRAADLGASDFIF